jgi:ammonia channel protein AmtB
MLAGLVMITPAGGFVSLTDAFLLGIIGSACTYQVLKFKSSNTAQSLKWVDPADVFATHCFGGVMATLLTGFFGSRQAAGFDGVTDIKGGVLHDGNWNQLLIQALEGLIGAVWSFTASYTIIALIDCVPGFEVLCTDEQLLSGMDNAQMLESLGGSHADEEADYEPISRQVRLD